jgi:hypothetical protein
MKKTILTTLTAAIFIGSSGYADDTVLNLESCEPTTSAPAKDLFFEYNNRITVFNPFYISYERTKPNALYWALLERQESVWNEDGHSRLITRAEFRMGYNLFFNARDHFSPYAGISFIHGYEHKIPNGMFGSLGFWCIHEFSNDFNLGVNTQALIGSAIDHRSQNFGKGLIVGIDAGLPFIFRFGHKRHWDFRLEPFDIYLHGSKSWANLVGLRNSIGYSF